MLDLCLFLKKNVHSLKLMYVILVGSSGKGTVQICSGCFKWDFKLVNFSSEGSTQVSVIGMVYSMLSMCMCFNF